MSDILIVDDERSMREFLEIMLTEGGNSVRTAASVADARAKIDATPPDLVITDLRMKGGSGLELLAQVKQAHPEVEFIVITAFATDETAVQALQLGAYDYVTKPFQLDEMRVVVQRSLERRRLMAENVRMRAELRSRYAFDNLVGKSPRMQEVYTLIDRVAETRSNVLITGESGTGKELVARAVHFRSDRSEQSFVPIDCGSIPETLMESELFGHKKGAFTGATADRRGLFELAHGGTAFLDEIGEVPLNLQVKLLRVIQERRVRRLGEEADQPVDVRIIAATNRSLEQEVQRGTFRADLYYRLNVIRIHLPPLRERREDIPELVRHFVGKIAAHEGKSPPVILSEAIDALQSYNFPGNVRELENLVERALALSRDRPIGPELFTDSLYNGREPTGLLPDAPSFPDTGVDLDAILIASERTLIARALEKSGGVKKRAAELLHISFRSLRYRLAKLHMDIGEDGEA